MDYMPIIEIRVNQLAKEIAGSLCSKELGEEIERKINVEFKNIMKNIDGHIRTLIISEIDNCIVQSVKNYFSIGSIGYEKIKNKIIDLLDNELKIDNSPKKR
jgi:hypothetical protein